MKPFDTREALEIRGARMRRATRPEAAPGMVNLGDLDPVDVEFLLRALGKMEPSAQRMRLQSWVTYSLARCERDEAS